MHRFQPAAFRQAFTVISGCLCCALAALPAASAADDLAVPESLARYHFVNAFVVTDAANPLFGMHEFYINTAGLGAFRRGGPYPEGANSSAWCTRWTSAAAA